MTVKPNASHHVRTNPALSRILSHNLKKNRPDCRIESSVYTGRQRKNYCFSVDGACKLCDNFPSKQWAVITTTVLVKKPAHLQLM